MYHEANGNILQDPRCHKLAKRSFARGTNKRIIIEDIYVPIRVIARSRRARRVGGWVGGGVKECRPRVASRLLVSRGVQAVAKGRRVGSYGRTGRSWMGRLERWYIQCGQARSEGKLGRSVKKN